MRPESGDLATVEPGGGDRSIGRRDFLKVGGVGLVGALLFGSAAVNSVAGAAEAQEGSSKKAPQASLMEEFREAAKEYGVPVGLLLAMGYVNTRWEMPSAKASEYEEGDLHGWGGYGIMALVKNPSTDTLGEAAELTGIPEQELKTDRKSNIMGGAALLAESMGELKPSELGAWFGAVSGRRAFGALGKGSRSFEAPAGVGGGEVFAEQVFSALREGATKETRGGERISLNARSEIRRDD